MNTKFNTISKTNAADFLVQQKSLVARFFLDGPSAIFWILVLAFPFIFLQIKFILGILLIILMHFRKSSVSATFDYICLSIVILNGFFVSYPYLTGEYNLYSLDFLWPLHLAFVSFWWLFIRKMSTPDLTLLSQVAILSAWIAWIYSMSFMLKGFGISFLNIPDPYDYSNVNTNEFKLASNFVSALLFTSPILSYLYLKSGSPIKLTLLVLFWIGVLATGRRSAFFGLGIAVIFLGFETIKNKKQVILSITVLLGLSGLIYILYILDILSIATMLNERVESLNGFDENVRIDQAMALWDGFLEKPLFGHGLGTNVYILRDEDKIWRYELTYIAAIYRYGIFGCAFYLVLYGLPFVRIAYRFRSLTIPQQALFVAALSQVFAYAVNPVLDTFDTCWQLLLPILYITQLTSHTNPIDQYNKSNSILQFK
jgi:hypothetical protein